MVGGAWRDQAHERSFCGEGTDQAVSRKRAVLRALLDRWKLYFTESIRGNFARAPAHSRHRSGLA